MLMPLEQRIPLITTTEDIGQQIKESSNGQVN